MSAPRVLPGFLGPRDRVVVATIAHAAAKRSEGAMFTAGRQGTGYDKLDLLEYRDAIAIIRDRVQDLLDQGMTLAQVQAADPTLGYRSQYGADSGAWTTEMFVAAVYDELAAKKGAQ